MKAIGIFCRTVLCGAAAVLFASSGAFAQNLTLEGQTGGFITPTAYVVPSEKKQFFSYPAVGYYFIDASKVIGNVNNFSITEGIANRAEFGYTRDVHQAGNSPYFSDLWHYSGMNVFHGKGVLIRDGQWIPFMPGLAAGFVVRTGDKFVSGAINEALGGPLKSYTNGDVYVVATKTWEHPPLPFIANLGWKFTNASIMGIGGQATRFQGRLFGGIGIPLPLPAKLVLVPAAGFSQQPPHSINLGDVLVGGGGRLPTTLDYAVRLTQRNNTHFSVGAGVGQVAGLIGQTVVQPVPGAPPVLVPVNLQARNVFGVSMALRY